MFTIKFKVRSLLAPVSLSVASILLMAPPAHAGELGGYCEVNELCLYWGSNQTGAVADYYNYRSDFGSQHFPYGCCTWRQGMGERVKNNAASAANLSSMLTARVYYNENLTGPFDALPPNTSRNFVNTWNDNASFAWYS